MERFDLMEVRGVGLERLSQGGPHLVVANHPTLADVVNLLAHLPQADCIVNVSRARNPFLRGAVAAAGYIRNDGGSQVVEESVRRLRAGRTVLVFPEGTRSPRGGLQPFQRGAAHVALRANCDLLPVVIDCQPPTLMKGQAWYEVPERTFRVTLRVEEPISPKPYADSGRSAPIAARQLTAELREWFAKSMAHHQGSSEGNPR
jgi:1-acyl-sn-glycerol-3-phosphate acyltransferase